MNNGLDFGGDPDPVSISPIFIPYCIFNGVAIAYYYSPGGGASLSGGIYSTD